MTISAEILADRLGDVQAEIAALREMESQIRGELLEELGGPGTVEGELFRVTISEQIRKVVNWQGIAKKLGASAQMIRGNTRETEGLRFNVSARKTETRKVAA